MRNASKNIVLFFIYVIIFTNKIVGQPFIEDIQNFKKQDSISFPPKNAILFVGSSSFTNWKDVQNYFAAYKIINRGFGGSSLPDVIRYANNIVFPYEPKQIVIYCGENDLAASDSITAKMVYESFVNLFKVIRRVLPETAIAFISLKPSPSRWYLKNKMIEANKQIEKYLLKKKKTAFINIFDKMLDKKGKPMKEIFLEDNLHMNAKGYTIWKQIIEPFLIK
jgi:lysophospholipase L1-like esterase